MGRTSWESRGGEWKLLPPPALGEKARSGKQGAVAGHPQLSLVAGTVRDGQGYLGWAGTGRGTWRGSQGGVVEVGVGDAMEPVEIDANKGPKIMQTDGSFSFFPEVEEGGQWQKMSSADQKVLAYKAARMNVATRKRIPELKRLAEERAKKEEAAAKERVVQGLRRELEEALGSGSSRKVIEARCRMEQARPAVPWNTIDATVVNKNHAKRAKGMLYGLEFPWNAELLEEMGPGWLTEAFHAAGTLAKSNRVTSVTIEKKIKIDAGNNAGKFLFEVTYEQQTPDLDTLLFAKVPYTMTKETSVDRISSSVLKQPMDLHEINTYRLIEAAFPMQTPKFYYGDISNETSNFILITARIPYAEVGDAKVGERKLKPFEVEGPYDKCKDTEQLRGPAEDYYMLLVKTAAKIAGLDKAGKMCSQEVLTGSLRGAPPPEPVFFGLNPNGATGGDPADIRTKLRVALEFVTDTARPLFPEYVTTQEFQDKFMNTMMTWSAYANEIQYWLHSDPAYVAMGHNNLNADNAYFWRNEEGTLDCGIIDWGGFGSGPLPHKMWWCFNCADFDQFSRTRWEYIDNFIATYQEYGGQPLDRNVYERGVLITSLGNMMFMVRAVPNCFKMCPKAEWATIKDRRDPRIADNIDGKSTLRTTLHVLNNSIRVLEELGSDKHLHSWIQDIYVGKWGQKAKTDDVIGIAKK